MKHIISLGAGVQSSTMALMFAKGELSPMPDFAVFADTQAEPDEVYEWLEWLTSQLPFPIVLATKGDLSKDILEVRTSKTTGKKYLKTGIPAYTENGGLLSRQCTVDYKIRLIQKTIRERLEIKYLRKEKNVFGAYYSIYRHFY